MGVRMIRKRPSITVDAVILKENKIVLIKRRNAPFKEYYALPGGFVDYGEKVEDAVIREVKEETGLKTKIEKLVGVYSAPDRDPRGHTITIVYKLNITGGELRSGDDAKEIGLFALNKLPKLAFDHKEIIGDFIRKEM
jgi:8-oxo-dGTP diphosphatase